MPWVCPCSARFLSCALLGLGDFLAAVVVGIILGSVAEGVDKAQKQLESTNLSQIRLWPTYLLFG